LTAGRVRPLKERRPDSSSDQETVSVLSFTFEKEEKIPAIIRKITMQKPINNARFFPFLVFVPLVCLAMTPLSSSPIAIPWGRTLN